MSERQIAIDILRSQGYLSKNALSRATGLSLKESGKVLDSFLPSEEIIPIFAVFESNTIKLNKTPSVNSSIYALTCENSISNAYKIEYEHRNAFYEKGFHYPPADSGIYIQESRSLVPLMTATPCSTVKPLQISKNNTVQPTSIIQPNPFKMSHSTPLENIPKVTDTSMISNTNNSTISKNNNSKPIKPSVVLGTKQKTINFASSIGNPKEIFQNSNKLTQINDKIEIKEETCNNNEEKITTPAVAVSDKFKKRKDTPYPNIKAKQDFNEIISNKNIYNEEEDDDIIKKDEEIIEEPKEIEIQNLKRKSKKQPPEKKFKSMNLNNYTTNNEVRKPIITKRKVMKTRKYIENGRLISEDYSSEEEVIFHPISAPIGKNKGKQTTLFGFGSSN